MKPEARNAKPDARNEKPEAPNAKPEARNPRPEQDLADKYVLDDGSKTYLLMMKVRPTHPTLEP